MARKIGMGFNLITSVDGDMIIVEKIWVEETR